MSARQRPPKPTALKESTRQTSQSEARGLQSMFAASVNALMPNQPPAPQKQESEEKKAAPVAGAEPAKGPAQQAPKRKSTPFTEAVTKVDAPTRTTQITGLTDPIAKPPTSAKPKISPKQKQRSETRTLLAIIALLLVGVLWIGIGEEQRSHILSRLGGSNAGPTYDREKFAERVQFHRAETGHRLNRERINAEYQNEMSRPNSELIRDRTKTPDVMAGLPLQGEAAVGAPETVETSPLDPDYPDARIQYSLQEEKDAQEWEERAQKQYVDEFLLNAARAGYRVKIDRNGQVTIKGRLSKEEMERLPSGGGSMR